MTEDKSNKDIHWHVVKASFAGDGQIRIVEYEHSGDEILEAFNRSIAEAEKLLEVESL